MLSFEQDVAKFLVQKVWIIQNFAKTSVLM